MTGEATDLVARLQGAADSFRDQVIAIDSDGPTARLMREAATLIEAQAAEIEGLRKALEPFAKAGQLFDTGDYAMYDASIYRPAAGDDFSLHSGHLLAARRAFLASRTERADG